MLITPGIRAQVCAVLFTAVAVARGAPSPNLLPNAELRGTESAVTGWNVNTQSGEYAYRRLAGAGPGGGAAIGIETVAGKPGGLARWYVDAFLIEGATYELSCAARLSGKATAEVWLPEHLRVSFTGAGDWATRSARFKSQRSGSQRFYFQCWGAGSVLFARPSLRLIAAGPPLCGEPIPARGGDIARIVVGRNPTPAAYACALDLRRIFAAVTGKQAEIAADYGEGRNLCVGTGPAELPGVLDLVHSDEGYFLYIAPKFIICNGRTPRAKFYAVQELLRRIGYRKIWPGPYGECLPPSGPLALPGHLCVGVDPAFAMRGGHFTQVEAKPGEKLHHVDTGDWIDWAARNGWNRWKASYSTTWDYGVERGGEWQEVSGHTVTETLVPPSLFDAHPDWFALVKGKRMRTHPIGTVAEPCVSNPTVVDHVTQVVLDYFRSHPNAKRYSIGANDEPSYWCECPRCKALDKAPVDWSKNGKGTFDLTDRWMWFVNAVAARVEREFPGRWIGTFAYASTTEPPRKVMPRKNVMIEFTAWDRCGKHRFLDPKCPINARGVKRLKAWLRIAKAVSVYSYLDYRYGETPQACLSSDIDFYRSLHKLGVRYIADEIDTTPHASPALLDLRARLFWNLNTTLDAVLVPFCKAAYGSAAADMRSFWLVQDRAVALSPMPHPTQNDLARFTPRVLAESERLLNLAETRELSSEQLARVERARMSLLFVCYYQAQARTDWPEIGRRREDILGIARKYGFALNLGGSEAIGGGYELPMAALGGRTLLALPDRWLLRVDPKAEGERDRWFAPDADRSAFKPISTSTNWERQWVGDYDGYAWYALDAVIPKTSAKHEWLLFGAVDETWDLWLNGVHAGASTGDPGEIWDKPSAAEITGKYAAGVPTHIVVRVHDSGGAGGIWKPVKITVSD